MKQYPTSACSSYPPVGPFITSWKQAFYMKKLLCSGIWQKGHTVCIILWGILWNICCEDLFTCIFLHHILCILD